MKVNRKEIKTNAKRSIKRNYIACIAVCFIMVFIAGEYSITTQGIAAYDNSNVADLRFSVQEKKKIVKDIKDNNLTPEEADDKYNINNIDAVNKWLTAYENYGMDGLNSKEVTFFGTTADDDTFSGITDIFSAKRFYNERYKSSINKRLMKISQTISAYFEGMTKGRDYRVKFIAFITGFTSKKTLWDTLVFMGNILFGLIFSVFVTNVLRVCELRFFMENRTYKKTQIGRLGFLFRERTFHPVKTMFIKDMLMWLWMLTIVGYPIMSYSYSLVPFICAENPNIHTMDALRLSQQMMRGHKFERFVLDLSMLGWSLLSIVTFGIAGVLFTNPYKTSVAAEFYFKLRREEIEKGTELSKELNDKYLDLDLLEEQLKNQAKADGADPEIVARMTAYTPYHKEETEEVAV